MFFKKEIAVIGLIPGGHFNLVCTGVCGHNTEKLIHQQAKSVPLINKNRPIPRLCTVKHEPNFDEITISNIQVTRKSPILR